MKRTFLLLVVFATVVCSSEGASALRELQEGMEAPAFSLSDLTGKNFTYQEVAGKKGTLVIFWQTTTKNSEKALREVQGKYADWRQKGLQVLAINMEGQNVTADDLKAIGNIAGQLSFPAFVDRGLALFDKLGVIALPTMILLDDKMVIQKEMSGFPLVGSQVFFEEVGYFLGEKRLVAKEVYKPVKQALLSYRMGIKLEKKKNYEKALELYEKAVSLDPAYVTPFVRLVEIYLSTHNPGAAKAALARIDNKIAANAVIMMSKGKLAYYEKDFVQAKKMFADSLSREETPDAYIYSAFIYLTEGQLQEGDNYLKQAVALSNNAPEVLYKIGKFFADKGDYGKANGYYKQALEQIIGLQ